MLPLGGNLLLGVLVGHELLVGHPLYVGSDGPALAALVAGPLLLGRHLTTLGGSRSE